MMMMMMMLIRVASMRRRGIMGPIKMIGRGDDGDDGCRW